VSNVVPAPAPPPQVTFTLTSSALPGTATNEDCETALPAAKDFGVGPAQTTAQQALVGAVGNTYTTALWSFDWGGTVTIEATGTLGDGTVVRGTLILPFDTDKDGLPDAFEALYSATLNAQVGDQNANGVADGQDRFARDGLSNFEKYRGVYLKGPVKGQTGLMANPQRLDPGWRHLFARGRGYGNDPLLPAGHCGVDPSTFAPVPDGALSATNPCPPFEVGAAFAERKVRVMDATGSFTATTELPTRSFANGTSPTLDLATVVYDGKNCNGGEACDQVSKIGVRNFSFPTLGFSTFGSSTTYGNTIRVFKRAVEAYFRSRPYEHRTNDPARVVVAPDGRPMLAPITLVGDANDNGLVDRREATVNGELAGDTYIPGTFSRQLSALDVNNDNCVELPLVTDPTKISGTCDTTAPVGTGHTSQATKRQVVRSVTTHELGHGAGINIHTTDPTDLMYQYSTNWTRSDHFSDTAANLIQIHNKGLQ
jgi:hypothetical protein